MVRFVYKIKGVVQGVGFRPFIYKLAQELSLSGFVFNDSSGVTIELQGYCDALEIFDERLYSSVPPLAHIDTLEKHPIKIKTDEKTFEIIQTTNDKQKTTLVAPDIKVCDDCLQDLKENGKFHNYFATNCTNCGPRYSIIQTVPYDRCNTSMSKFTMCKSCQEQYENPLDRRYHAQPISCKNCGPKLELIVTNEEVTITNEIYTKVTTFIKDGKIGAIKGIGGFHIVCDATNDEVVQKLRKYKNRPTKPFAIMCKDLEQIEQFAHISDKEKELLTSKEAPIVILDKLNHNTNLSNNVAPNINKIGCFLPYTPLHFLLFEQLHNPIVATSANLADEPIIISKDDILQKLPFLDFVLDFDREIVNGVDDSLVQIVDGKIQTLRLARGYSPKIIKLSKKLDKKILAVGANAKNTIAIAFDDTMIVSAHIGDLDSIVAFEYFTRTIETYRRFYDFVPDIIVCDKHPNYETTKWSLKQDKPILQVQHHLAHIYSVKAEFGLSEDCLGFSFDGTGYGDDGTLWGGEIFVGDERKYHFKQIKLLGGAKAIKEPRRVALSMLFDKYSLDEVASLQLDVVKSFSPSELKMLHQSFSKNLNAPLSSSVGRLFDGVASFASLLQFQSYEGQAGLGCEMAYDNNIKNSFPYTLEDGVIDIQFDFFHKDIVSLFINTLVNIIIDIAKIEQLSVILSGGVFQNKTLLEMVVSKLKDENIKYYYNQKTAINDGGISLGQLYYAVCNNLANISS